MAARAATTLVVPRVGLINLAVCTRSPHLFVPRCSRCRSFPSPCCGRAPGQAKVRPKEPRRNPRRLEDDGQTAPRMRAAAYEVDAGEVLEPVPRPQVQHLAKVVRQVEH